MREGREVLHQGCFVRDGWVGYPDFLIRVDEPSDLGRVVLRGPRREARQSPAAPAHLPAALLHRRARAHPGPPARAHASDARRRDSAGVRARRLRRLRGAGPCAVRGAATRSSPAPTRIPRIRTRSSECQFCHWWKVCRDRRRDDDHVSLVANLQRGQGLKLEAAGDQHRQRSRRARAEASDRAAADRRDARDAARAGRRCRSAAAALERPLFELLEPERRPRPGAPAASPPPATCSSTSRAIPYWGEDGLEYLFGTGYEEDGEWRYWPLWATLARRGEARARGSGWTGSPPGWRRTPTCTSSTSTPTSRRRSRSSSPATRSREHELDELLRRKVFVDLYGITRQAMRGGRRELRAEGARAGLRLRARRRAARRDRLDAALAGLAGRRRPRSTSTASPATTRTTAPRTRALYALAARAPPGGRGAVRQSRSMRSSPSRPSRPSAKLRRLPRRGSRRCGRGCCRPARRRVRGHRRAARACGRRSTCSATTAARPSPPSGRCSRGASKTLAQLRDEDSEAIGGPRGDRRDDRGDKRITWRMRFPEQEYKLSPGDVDDPVAERGDELSTLDEAARTLVVTRTRKKGDDPPLALGPGGPYATDAQVDALFRFADRVADARRRAVRPARCRHRPAAAPRAALRPGHPAARRRAAGPRAAARRRCAGSTAAS